MPAADGARLIVRLVAALVAFAAAGVGVLIVWFFVHDMLAHHTIALRHWQFILAHLVILLGCLFLVRVFMEVAWTGERPRWGRRR